MKYLNEAFTIFTVAAAIFFLYKALGYRDEIFKLKHDLYTCQEEAAPVVSDSGYYLYSLTYRSDNNYRQAYVISKTQVEATEALNQEVTAIRRIDVPLLIVTP